MLLDNINDEGKIDQLAIQTYVDEYDIELPTMSKHSLINYLNKGRNF